MRARAAGGARRAPEGAQEDQAVRRTEREELRTLPICTVFQRDLCKLRLETARSYVKIITSGEAGISMGGGGRSNELGLSCSVMGLGPIFKLKIEVTNAGADNLQNVPLCVGYDPEIYRCERPSQTVPLLLPNVTLTQRLSSNPSTLRVRQTMSGSSS